MPHPEPWEIDMQREIRLREIRDRVPKAGKPHSRKCSGCNICFRRPTRTVQAMPRFRGKIIGPVCYSVPIEAVEVPFTDLTQEQRHALKMIPADDGEAE